MKNTVKVGEMTFGWGAGLPQYGPPMALGDDLYGTLSEALAAADCILFVAPALLGEELHVLSPTLETQRPLAKPGAEGQKVQVYKVQTPSAEWPKEGGEEEPRFPKMAEAIGDPLGLDETSPADEGEEPKGVPDESPGDLNKPREPAVSDATGDEGEAEGPAPPKEREGA